jgi:hypothetical protein
MREPDIAVDGWCLEDGEAYHLEAPDTFWIPDRDRRENLQPGDFAKLIFRISVDNPEQPDAVERMWVLVRERVTGGYLGVLDNDPDAIAENDEFWSGVELPFAARHVININPRDEKSIASAQQAPKRKWSTA